MGSVRSGSHDPVSPPPPPPLPEGLRRGQCEERGQQGSETLPRGSETRCPETGPVWLNGGYSEQRVLVSTRFLGW